MARQRDVCRYYLQGRCHYGANCRFLHPPRNQQQQQQGYGQSSTVRFDNGRNWGDRQGGRGSNLFESSSGYHQQNYRGRGGGGGRGWSQGGSGWGQSGGNWSGGSNWRGGRGNDGWRGGNDGWRGGSDGWRGGSDGWRGGNDGWRGGGRGSDGWRGGGRGGGGGRGNWSGGSWFSNDDRKSGSGWSGMTSSKSGGNLKSNDSWFDRASNWQSSRRVSWEDEINMTIEDTSVEPTASHIVVAIKEDLSNWEKGQMWPLSCYSPAPSGTCPNLTNMEDHSMEEIRHLAYEAQAGGTSQQYIDNVRGAYEKQRTLFQQYQSITTDEIIQFITGSKPNTTPASVRTGSHSSVNAAAGGGGNGLVTPVKDLFGVKETKQNSLHSDSNQQQISDKDLQAFQAKQFVGGSIPETPPPNNLC